MNDSVSLEKLASALRHIYREDSSGAEVAIERYLLEELGGASQSERLALLNRLGREFKGGASSESPVSESGSDVVAKLSSLFLGKQVSKSDLSSTEFLTRLADSLNTVFNSLNEIVGVINTTLLGRKAELETIRQIIGSDIHEQLGGGSLEDYLSQIRKAFLTSHRAFQETAAAKVAEVLHELDPARIQESERSGLKIGPLKKAGRFDLYEERFRNVRKWFDSERFSEDLLREFERTCQKLHERRRTNP